jgi:hypothetical protein
MANIYEWLENVDPPSYAPPVPSLEPADGNPFAGVLMNQITPLDIDEQSNMYFDMPHA